MLILDSCSLRWGLDVSEVDLPNPVKSVASVCKTWRQRHVRTLVVFAASDRYIALHGTNAKRLVQHRRPEVSLSPTGKKNSSLQVALVRKI